MKWKNEIPNKTEFMKINSFHFIECEKFHSELVHEENAGKFSGDGGQRKEVKETRRCDKQAQSDCENKERTMSEIITLTKSQTDFTGSSPKRYTTKCFIKPVTTPVWYTESLFLNIDSSKRKYNEKIYFKEKLLPFRWSESMITEVKTGPKCIYSDLVIPVDDCRDEVHYISLEPQQRSVKSTDL
ncbi:uncharacterized protein LOC123014459 isoform X2 [Tribolium madens]|uniref:uncharacterized protein LOC123014459 isoform X2 n=1 Tax=Tribolium madens TaxID=41895 RepID=UPI001CF76008|nr:uncharacterized protein LOC123014459 isoform X2 [Tribolium madens]